MKGELTLSYVEGDRIVTFTARNVEPDPDIIRERVDELVASVLWHIVVQPTPMQRDPGDETK